MIQWSIKNAQGLSKRFVKTKVSTDTKNRSSTYLRLSTSLCCQRIWPESPSQRLSANKSCQSSRPYRRTLLRVGHRVRKFSRMRSWTTLRQAWHRHRLWKRKPLILWSHLRRQRQMWSWRQSRMSPLPWSQTSCLSLTKMPARRAHRLTPSLIRPLKR